MKVDIAQLESEIESYRKHLNLLVGPISFGIGLGCLSLKTPQLFACIGTLFVMIVAYGEGKYFPRTISQLRDQPKTKKKKVVLTGIMRKHFSIPAILTGFTLFFISWLFLIFIATGVIKNWDL